MGNFNVNAWTQPGQDFKLQASRHHYLNLAVVISITILFFIQLIRDREKVYTIDSNVNKCHWHSPMRKQLRRALEMLKATCQPCPSPPWMHQKYIYEQNKYVPWLRVCYIWVHNMDAYALPYFTGTVDPPICQLPEFFYPTFPWNHTIEVESYHLTVLCLSNNQDHMMIT